MVGSCTPLITHAGAREACFHLAALRVDCHHSAIPPIPPQGLTPEAQRWAAALLADAKLLATAPALADPQALLASATRLDSSFICMPQQRNTYGRVFGGFLMRCAGLGGGRDEDGSAVPGT